MSTQINRAEQQYALFVKLTIKSTKKTKKGRAGVIALVFYMYLQVGIIALGYARRNAP